ncbi:MAG: DUF3098 domain-containing protein [Bacteroidaceae bacterium]|nr:DUF3098 domain-containing protein [Bacteroidaceae bacterium]
MKQYFAFTRLNFILLAVAMAIVVVGMILMSGDGSTKDAFNPDIFSATRIKVAPLVCLLGYILMIVAIMFPSKRRQEIDDEPVAAPKPAKPFVKMPNKGNAIKGQIKNTKVQIGKNKRH